MRGCPERMDAIEARHPRLGRAVRPIHNVAMRHLPEGVRTAVGGVAGRVVTVRQGIPRARSAQSDTEAGP